MDISRDLLETVIGATNPTATHRELVSTLRSRLGLDSLRLSKIDAGYSIAVEHCHVVGEDGASLGLFKDWARNEWESMGRNALAVWNHHKDGPLRLTSSAVEHLYLTVPYGEAPEAFHQIVVAHEITMVDRRLFNGDSWSAPRDYSDLVEAARQSEGISPVPFGAPRYCLEALRDIQEVLAAELDADLQAKARTEKLVLVPLDKDGKETGQATRYYDEFPELRGIPPRGRRLMSDWTESSAGKGGAVFSEHWVFTSIQEFTDARGHRSVSVIPGWATSKKLPEIKFKRNESIHGLWDRMLAFDKKVGHSFAWYFYMLHGNRIQTWTARAVFKGVEDGLIVLPEHDYQVLRRFIQHPYGF